MKTTADAFAPRVQRVRAFRFGILSFCGFAVVGSTLLILTPSAKDVRRERATKRLIEQYRAVDKDSLAPFLSGNIITINNDYQPVTSDKAQIIYVWMPTSGSSRSLAYLSEITSPILAFGVSQTVKRSVFMAPNPESPGWTLLCKMHLAYFALKKPARTLFSFHGEMGSKPVQAIQKLTKLWEELPLDLRKKVEGQIAENRKVFSEGKLEGKYFQTGTGMFFDIGSSSADKCIGIAGNEFPY